MASGTSGPDALRWLREVSGLTQRGLAARSGVSERTIRGLERGQVRTPHQTSLRALTEAADLDDQQTATFLRAWAPDRIESLAELSDQMASYEQAIAETTLQSEMDEHLVSSWTRYTYRRGALVSVDADLVLEAQRDGIDTYVTPYVYDSGEGSHMAVKTTGCRLRKRYDFDHAWLQVFEIELPTPLKRGESCAFSLELIPAEPVHRDPAEETEWCMRGLHRTVPLTVIEVVFEEGTPSTVWEIEMARGGERRRLREVPLSPDGRAHLTRRHGHVGAYGFEWTSDVQERS